MKKIPSISISELIEAGVHFGHKTMRWNPKMSSYLYGIKDDVHIIDLQQTLPLLNSALEKIYDVARNNGRILFVGTKMQASDVVAEAAKRCGQYYINHRWLGGTLTNWITINRSIKKLADLEKSIEKADAEEENSDRLQFTKKERLDITRKIEKLEKSLGGIREMGGVPNLLFVIDTNKEDIAVCEARKLGIPVVAILDSNSNPDHITFPVPGNDDATRSIKLYCRLVSDAVLAGMQESLIASGVDLGEATELSDILQLNNSFVERKAENKQKDFKKKSVKAEVKQKTEEKPAEANITAKPKATKAKAE
jgi:small subunit ribosomal protein S2